MKDDRLQALVDLEPFEGLLKEPVPEVTRGEKPIDAAKLLKMQAEAAEIVRKKNEQAAKRYFDGVMKDLVDYALQNPAVRTFLISAPPIGVRNEFVGMLSEAGFKFDPIRNEIKWEEKKHSLTRTGDPV